MGSKSNKRPGLSVKIRSIQEVLLVCICVGSLICWEKPFEMMMPAVLVLL